MANVEYSIVIPVYNSTKSLIELAEQIHEIFQKLNSSYEIIFVNDGSPNPDSWETIKKLAKQNPNITGVQLMRNFGKEAALLAGFSTATGEYIITMDDDLQHSPYDIPKLIEQKHHDVVILAFPKKHHTFLQKLTSKLRLWFERKYLEKPKDLKVTPYRLYNRKIIDAILNIKSPYPYITGYMYTITQDIVNVWGEHHPRKYETSNFSMKKRWRLFLNLLINNTPFLLKFMINLGSAITIFSFGFAIYIIIKKILGKITISGWTTIVVLLSFFSGIIIFFLGILGEYILRILNTSEHRPPFIIREIIKSNA